ncbi:hypothetical protein TNCV_2285061 [Trichonephila clavipes]|nr:hypothetical protein TNCV_2285061 [Trichonephila clavipes]
MCWDSIVHKPHVSMDGECYSLHLWEALVPRRHSVLRQTNGLARCEDNHLFVKIALFACGKGACVPRARVLYATSLAEKYPFRMPPLACLWNELVKTRSSITGVHAFHQHPALQLAIANEPICRNRRSTLEKV